MHVLPPTTARVRSWGRNGTGRRALHRGRGTNRAGHTSPTRYEAREWKQLERWSRDRAAAGACVPAAGGGELVYPGSTTAGRQPPSQAPVPRNPSRDCM